MGLSRKVLNAAEIIRPVLVKILPASLLSKVKAGIVQKTTDNLDKVVIEPFNRLKNKDGINLIGSINSDTGLGQSMRLVADIIDASGTDYTVYNYYVPPGGSMNDTAYRHKITNECPYNINLIHVNASEFTRAFIDIGQEVWNGRYNIAYWLWELEEFPKEWLGNMNLVDEIWTPAEFISRTLRKYTDKPVHTIPYAVTAPTEESFTRQYFNLPEDKFLYLMMFDGKSRMERKNPVGVIEAFKKAYTADDVKKSSNVGLVVKINEPENGARDIAYIKEALKGYENVYFICETLSKVEVNSLIKCADVFVSLHRAEGFGLVLAEAMYVGTPAIATNWSANIEFMNNDVACMVDAKMIEIGRDMPPFKKEYKWADADIGQAADYMRKLYEDKEYYDKIKSGAAMHIRKKLNIENSVDLVKNRLNEIMTD
ncbi:MAG: glycosyltransferase [Eubacteriales bacterium]|nr:glycosyltransferase [Eubacteriales bacterium]